MTPRPPYSVNSSGDRSSTTVIFVLPRFLSNPQPPPKPNLQAVMRSSPIVVALATFAAYVLSGNELDAQTAFTALALFGTIAHPFHVLPKVSRPSRPRTFALNPSAFSRSTATGGAPQGGYLGGTLSWKKQGARTRGRRRRGGKGGGRVDNVDGQRC